MPLPRLFPTRSLPALFAAVTLALIVVRAAGTVDAYWDTLAYHWTYAARAAGICARDCFALPAVMDARYDGFPLWLHTLQGWLWRATGTPGMGDLVGIAMLLAVCLYLRVRFAVPLAWSWLAFLAIPLVQVQLTSTYIDLPVNAAVTLALLVLLRMLTRPDGRQLADVALALATGSKYQMVPVALLVWTAIVVLATRDPARVGLRRRDVAFVALSVAGALALLPNLVANLVMFGNPVYPVAIGIGPLHFAGPEAMPVNSIADAWARTPGPLRWLASVTEYDAFRGRPVLWTIDQGDVQQSNPSFRMGGYFVPYVLGLVALVGWSARTVSAARGAVAVLVALTLLCALMPNSHELRYYMFWMLSLVAIALALVHSPAFRSERQPLQRGVGHALVAISAASVILMTGGAYLRTGGVTLQDLVRETDAAVAQIPDGATLCIRNNDRRAFLYSSAFHPGRHYATRVLEGDEAGAACTVRLSLD